jgi:hypothetical protein
MCIYVCLTSPTPFTLNRWEKWFLHPAKIPKYQISPLVFYCISSRLVTLLKVIDTPIQVTNIVDLTVSFKFINFNFQTFLLFVPEMSTNFISYNVEVNTMLWFGFCDYCISTCFFWYKNLKHSSFNHGCCCFNTYGLKTLFRWALDILFVFSRPIYFFAII